MSLRFKRKAVAVGLASAVSLATGVAAFAYWSTTGSGTGAASTTAGESITITQTNTVADLEPGQTTPDQLLGTLTVSNGRYAYVGAITPTVTGTSNAGCTSSDFTVMPSTYNAEVMGSASGVTLGTIAFNDTTANQDACKNATVYLSYSSDGGSGTSTVTAESSLYPSAAPSTGYSALNAVSCPANGFCMAVGGYSDSTNVGQGMADVLSGGSWTTSTLPFPSDPTATSGAGMEGISCPSTSFCVAVGEYSDTGLQTNGVNRSNAIVGIWNGTGWTLSSPPMPSDANPANGSNLVSISCTDATHCTAAGDYGPTFSPGTPNPSAWAPLIETLSGSTWTASAPSVPSDANPLNSDGPFDGLTGVSCSDATHCVAVGNYQTTGTGGDNIGVYTLADGTWTSAPLEMPADHEWQNAGPISCPAVGSCVFVNSFALTSDPNGTVYQVYETLSGGTWTERAMSAPRGSSGWLDQIDALSCTSTTSCVAAGQYGDASWAIHPEAATLSGGDLSSGTWTASASGSYPSDVSTSSPEVILASVSCSSPSFCEAVGQYNNQNGSTLAHTQQVP